MVGWAAVSYTELGPDVSFMSRRNRHLEKDEVRHDGDFTWFCLSAIRFWRQLLVVLVVPPAFLKGLEISYSSPAPIKKSKSTS